MDPDVLAQIQRALDYISLLQNQLAAANAQIVTLNQAIANLQATGQSTTDATAIATLLNGANVPASIQ